MESIELADGGLLLYDAAFLAPDLADRYFVELRGECAWEQKPGVFGHLQPRLTASYGDDGVTYRYSGTENVALPWTSTLLEIKQKIEKIEAVRGNYNYCLLNRYRSGSDSVGWHADDKLLNKLPMEARLMAERLIRMVVSAPRIVEVERPILNDLARSWECRKEMPPACPVEIHAGS